jgi:energy-coupling factor transporter ATP-binding protein EcfA2
LKVKSVAIENFRSIQSATINLEDYTCFVGPNGAGKSNILAALGVFFCDSDMPTYSGLLHQQDFYSGLTSNPIRITLTFRDMPKSALDDLAAYIRGGELSVTAEAAFDPTTNSARVLHYGQRLGIDAFRTYFDLDKKGAKVEELKRAFASFRQLHPGLREARTKADMEAALREYEHANLDKCQLIPSEDNFYGANSLGKLNKYIQWEFVSAVKDAKDEAQEGKRTVIGRLIARVVRSYMNFEQEVSTLKAKVDTEFQALLAKHRQGLSQLASSLQNRLRDWSHPEATLDLEWLFDPDRSVVIREPIAGVRTGDSSFVGDVTRMGHGLQRSYLLAILQELAAADAPDAPTLLLGCEEPELYQHPPQATHLATVLQRLAKGNNQVLVTTHSPRFVQGDAFECIRPVCLPAGGGGSKIVGATKVQLTTRIASAVGPSSYKSLPGAIARIHQSLASTVSDLFFARVPVLVEGPEDAAYIAAHLHVSGKWDDFRRIGGHIVWCGGKYHMVAPVAVTVELGLTAYVVIDSDRDSNKRESHRAINSAILKLLGESCDPFPESDHVGRTCAVWKNTLKDSVKSDFGSQFETYQNKVEHEFAHEGDIGKSQLFVARLLQIAAEDGVQSPTLVRLCDAILRAATPPSTSLSCAIAANKPEPAPKAPVEQPLPSPAPSQLDLFRTE